MSEFTEWKSLRFKDICRLKSDKITVDSSDIQTYISTENMLPNFGGVQSAKNIPLTGKLNTFKYGEVLFSNIRTYFKKVWIATFDGVASPDVLIFSAMKNCESQYLYYMMCEPQFTEFTVLTSRGAKMPRGDKEAILNYEISLPSLAEQKAIASVLSSLDNKIDLLHRQNKTLELMAETLFRQWFVEEAQDDWDVYSLEEVSTISIGRTPPRKNKHLFSSDINDVKWLSIKDMGKSGIYRMYTEEYLPKSTIESFKIPIIPTNTVVLSFKMTVGRVGITHEEMVSNEAIAQFNIKKIISTEFLYCFLKQYNYDSLGTTSSIVTSINTGLIKSIQFSIPNDTKVAEFTQRTKPFFEKVKKNQMEIQTLEKLRDTLLPKLMSGEVRVNYTPEEIKQ